MGVLLFGIDTLKQIQSLLNGSRNLTVWKNKLVSNYNNPTEGFVNDVFDDAIFSMYNHQNWPNN